ncbi:MAG TPA: cell division ATP-binding protein FtsE [Rhodospirillaceae bacterium]|nr:MAG: cell division ATP-binding protein FtsE [Alphaproteobacteria bacterium GWF2_58_20]HAU29602.1 cell division ATP-binding protein FtsE [Rhodospirillaceae bacterium]
MTQEQIILTNVGLHYESGPDILCDINLTITSGSFQFITGPSGVGKSSLLRVLGLLQKPTRGKANIFGHDVGTLTRHNLSALRRRIGIVYQDFRLIDSLSLFDNVALPLRITGTPEAEIAPRVRELLDWVDLADCMHGLPATVSGGQQQRAAIARAVIARPDIILADEPTGNLDDALAARLIFLFQELVRLGTTVVIATHNTSLVQQTGYPCLHLVSGMLEHKESMP